jgi:putative heme-binding domain-containing protein
MRRTGRSLSIALGLVLCLPALAQAQRASEQAQVDAGARLFTSSCQVCHGEAGVGNRAPTLRGSRLTADYITKAIVEGKAGTMMPKFGDAFKPEQVQQLTRYIISLQQPDSPWTALRGNAAAGEQVFFDAAVSTSCYHCHRFLGRGARVGPDLTARLKGKSPREVFQKIVIVPHRAADPAYLSVAIATRGGGQAVGIKAEETATELRFYDTSKLPPSVRTLPKADIVSIKPLHGSAMPSDYASRLPLQHLLDLVAFLKSGVERTRVEVSFDDVIQERLTKP